MTEKNQHGLPRYIPEDIKKAVRKRDGFGCILCAVPIVDYEHVDPLFTDAHEHKAECITLLCPNCHRKVTGGQISKDIVKAAMLSPAAKKTGQIGDQIYFCDVHPEIIFAGARFTNCQIPIRAFGEDIVFIEQEDEKFFLTAKLWDSCGKQTLQIKRNQWIASTDNIWDFKVIGNRFHIQEKEQKPAMIIRVENNSSLIIERFDMLLNNSMRFTGDQDKVTLNGTVYQTMSISDCVYGMILGF